MFLLLLIFLLKSTTRLALVASLVTSSDREFLDTLSHVVVCEFYRTDGDGVYFCEMDCESLEHARTMARSQIDRLGAISCAIRAVGSNGKLSKPIEYHN